MVVEILSSPSSKMSEKNKAKIEAAKRLLREHQKKKEKANNPPVGGDAQPSLVKSSYTPESNEPNNGYGLVGTSNSTATPSPTAFVPESTGPVNGNGHLTAAAAFSFPHDLPTNVGSHFFDNLHHATPHVPDSYKPPSATPPLFHSLAIADRTDSISSSISTKSDDDSARRLTCLESQLALEVGRKEELESRLSEAQNNVRYLENEVTRLQDTVGQLSKETPSEDKFNIQLRTIEILVSEKSELQQELALVIEENKRNSEKCMEFSVKMKALKSEVARLQASARDNNEARQQHNSILKKLEHSLNESNALADQYRKDIELNHEEIKELKEIIREHSSKVEILQKELDQSNRKLSLAEMKIAQYGGDLQDLTPSPAQNFEVECEKLREEVARMRGEVAENTAQYKNYIETLNGQLQQSTSQYEACLREKNELLAHKEGLLKQLCNLEKQMTKERQTGPSLSQSNQQLTEQLSTALKTVEELKSQLEEKTRSHGELSEELSATAAKLQETELALEQLEVPDAKLLQAAMESDRIAASRAIEQNTSLKAQLAELSSEMNHSIVKLNNEKLDLTEKLQHSEYLVKELQGKLEKYRHKEEVAYTDSVAQCPMIFQRDFISQTDVDDLDVLVDPEHATPEAMKLLEEKLKKTMGQVAELSDEKQRLEHLVLQLQGETETICEYVTLYQNQRVLLREKMIERERQLALLAKERKDFKEKLSQINHLLPQVTSEVCNGEHPQTEGDAASKIKTLLTEIESSNLVQERIDGPPNTFHPCLLCSGKLITV